MERDCVLNHRVGHHGALFPGDHIEGVLCGTGQSCMPDDYRHRQHFPYGYRSLMAAETKLV